MIKGLNYNFTASYVEDEDGKHHYYKNGKELIGATTLMKKHNLGVYYESVDEEKLKKCAEYGKTVHKELESFIKDDMPSFSSEVMNFEIWSKQNHIEYLESELKVNNDLVGGSIDFIYEKDNEIVIADFKTTASIHKEAVSWQLSIYRELLGMEIKKGVCFHIRGGLFEVVDIPLKTKEEVNKLFDAERNGEIYESYELINNESVEALVNLQLQLMVMEEEKKKIEKAMDSFKDYALQEMEKRGLLRWEVVCNGIKLNLTRVLEGKSTGIDKDKLKLEHPEIFEEYKTTSIKKSYVRVSCKANE